MTGSQFLIIVVSVFLILTGFLVFSREYRSWIYNLFSAIITAILIVIAFFALDTSYFSSAVKIKTTNYSKRKGQLYFFEGEDCSAQVKYGFSVNANEESWLELNESSGKLETVILLSQDDHVFQVPAPDYKNRRLDIWEKELQRADDCFKEKINALQREQAFFSLAVGLLLFGLLLLFGYRRKLKRKPDGIIK